MFSSHTKIFAAGLFSLGAIAAVVSPVQAQPNSQVSGIFTESNFDAPPDENNDGLQGGAGGATRSLSSCTYAALIPEHGYSSTKESHPTIWLYVAPIKPEKPIEPEKELFVQASLYLHPLNSPDSSPEQQGASSELDEALSPIIALLQGSKGYEFPVAIVRDKLSGENLISLKIPQHAEGLSHLGTYSATIELGCGFSEELLDQDLKKIETDGSTAFNKTTIFAIRRDEAIATSATSEVSRSWLDTVDAIARLSQTTDIPDDATTTALLRDWEMLLEKTASRIQVP